MKIKAFINAVFLIVTCFMVKSYAVTIYNQNKYPIEYWIANSWTEYYACKYLKHGYIEKGKSAVWTENRGFISIDKPQKIYVGVKSTETGAGYTTSELKASTDGLVLNEDCELTVKDNGTRKIIIEASATC